MTSKYGPCVPATVANATGFSDAAVAQSSPPPSCTMILTSAIPSVGTPYFDESRIV